MAMSGVELDPQCKVIYDEVQSKKKHRYVTFMIADGKIKVDKVSWIIQKHPKVDTVIVINVIVDRLESVTQIMTPFWSI